MVKTSKKKEFLTELRNCFGLITIAAQKVGISRQTVWNWQNQDMDFKASIEEINAHMVDQVSGFLLKEIQKGNMTGILFYLKCKGGWIEKNEQILSGAVGNPQNVVFRFTDSSTVDFLKWCGKQGRADVEKLYDEFLRSDVKKDEKVVRDLSEVPLAAVKAWVNTDDEPGVVTYGHEEPLPPLEHEPVKVEPVPLPAPCVSCAPPVSTFAIPTRRHHEDDDLTELHA